LDTALSPGFARTTYTGLSGVHHLILPINIDPAAVAGTQPDVTLKNGTTTPVEAVLNDFWEVAAEIMADDQHIGLCEVYKVNATTGEGTFLWGFDLDMVGASGGAGVEMGMMTLSFKLINGRTYKFVLLDTPAVPNQKVYPPFASGGSIEAMAAYAVAATSPIYGRGNAYPFAPIAWTTKTSDALRSREGLA
jgi:hypothetical protein